MRRHDAGRGREEMDTDGRKRRRCRGGPPGPSKASGRRPRGLRGVVLRQRRDRRPPGLDETASRGCRPLPLLRLGVRSRRPRRRRSRTRKTRAVRCEARLGSLPVPRRRRARGRNDTNSTRRRGTSRWSVDAAVVSELALVAVGAYVPRPTRNIRPAACCRPAAFCNTVGRPDCGREKWRDDGSMSTAATMYPLEPRFTTADSSFMIRFDLGDVPKRGRSGILPTRRTRRQLAGTRCRRACLRCSRMPTMPRGRSSSPNARESWPSRCGSGSTTASSWGRRCRSDTARGTWCVALFPAIAGEPYP